MTSLQPFSLVGGTALSLRFGHRSSVDLDLFYHEKFDQPFLVKELESMFGDKFIYKHQHISGYFRTTNFLVIFPSTVNTWTK